jgi:hypothetical protein
VPPIFRQDLKMIVGRSIGDTDQTRFGRKQPTLFTLDDFRLFIRERGHRSPTERAALRKKLFSFTKALVETESMREVTLMYGVSEPKHLVRAGEFRPEAFSYWVSIGPKESRNRCHFTVRIAKEGLALEVFSPYRSYTTALVKQISADPTAFVQTLNTIPNQSERYHFRLREAYYCDPTSPYKGQCISRRVDYIKVHPSAVTVENVNEFVVEPTLRRLDEDTFRPEVFLVADFPLSDVVERSNAVDMLASAVTPMIPYYRFAFNL